VSAWAIQPTEDTTCSHNASCRHLFAVMPPTLRRGQAAYIRDAP
jgi:hypothetical protein